MKESQIQNGAMNYLRSCWWICERINSGNIKMQSQKWKFYNFRWATSWFPDLISFLPSWKTLFVEVKAEKWKLRLSQENYHEKLTRLWHIVLVVKSVEDLEEDLTSLKLI